MEMILDFVESYGVPLLKAIPIYLIGSRIITKSTKAVRMMKAKGAHNQSLQKFMANLVSWGLKIFLLIMVIFTLGVERTSLAAVIAAAVLAIGLAL